METIILFIKTTIKGSKSLLQVAKTTHHNNKKNRTFWLCVTTCRPIAPPVQQHSILA